MDISDATERECFVALGYTLINPSLISYLVDILIIILSTEEDIRQGLMSLCSLEPQNALPLCHHLCQWVYMLCYTVY